MMKKIKFLILALLGIIIIPTTTNALNTTNYTKVYRQCAGRATFWVKTTHNGERKIYCADSSYGEGDFFRCGVGGLSSFKPSASLYYNYVHRNTTAYVKGQLLDTIGYFYFGYDKNPQNEKIDVSEFTINLPKNGLVNFFRFGKSKDYTDFLPNRFGLTLLDTTVVSDWKVATSVGGTMLYGKYIAYENNKLVLYDFENKIRYVRGKIDNLEVDHIHGGYAVLRAIQNQKPEEVYRVEFASSSAAGYIPVFSESWQSDLVYGYKTAEILESKMVSEYDGNPQIGGGTSENSQKNYNQCLAYYNSVKTYASYDRNCYKDLLDNNQDIGLRQQITDWDGEGEGPATDNRICNLRKGYKKSYKTKFKDKWSEFLELSSANRLSPHSLNVKDYCGEKPRDDGILQALKDFFSSPSDYMQNFRDRFNGYDGRPIGTYSGENYYNYDFQADSSKLKMYYDECYSKELVYKILTETDRQNSCQKYQELKSKMQKIYGNLTGVNFSSGFNEFVKQIEKDKSNDDIGLGKQFLAVFTDPFYSGYNQIDWVPASCSGQTSTFFEPFLYLVFGYIVFYFLRLVF